MRTTPSVRSRASSAALGAGGFTLVGAGGSVATGPMEEVTPWEVQVPTYGSTEIEREGGRSRTSLNALPAAPYGVSRALAVDAAPFAPAPSPTTPGAQSVRSNGTGEGTGAVEEVTPWEVQSGPGETVYGVTREVRVLTERERSRSVLSFHSTSGTGTYGNTPTTTATTLTNGTGLNNSNSNNNSKAPSVRSGRSRASSAMHSPGGFGTTSTGSVEEVTPWEMYPAPPVLHAPPPPLPPPPGSSSSARHSQQGDRTAKAKEGRRWGRKSSALSDGRAGADASNDGGSGANTPMPGTIVPSITATTSTSSNGAGYARSVKSTHTHKSTGPVEDVTPWEMQEMPASPPLVSGPVTQRAATLESSFSYLANADINGQVTVSPNSNPVSSRATTSSSSIPARPLIPTGLAEEVTPWETAAELPVQVERISANSDAERAPLGVSELELSDELLGEGSTPNTAMFTSSSGHYNGSAHGPLSAVSHASYASNAHSYVSGTSTTTGAGAARGSMTLEQLAEVMPWELHPVPTRVGAAESDVEKMAKERKGKRTQDSQANARQSTSGAGAAGGVAQALAEFGLRRRRSTGASGAEAMAMASGNTSAIEGGGTAARSTKKSSKLSRLSTSGVVAAPVHVLIVPYLYEQGVSSSDMIPPADAAAYPGPHPESAAAASIPKLKQKAKATLDHDAADDRFSTADRTILEELKASIRAREAQFKLKGVGHTVLGGGRCSGKKYHVYPKEIVPYPRSYERDVIDLLEIGCGTGTWILHCARTWKECHFVGLDIVSLHPDLQNVGSPDLASRITWVQHNFLEGLPFQNEEFDFVHIKRIALGVPEDKWDSFFEEVARVMKPGGRLEIIEEDLFFPGKKVDDEDENPIIFVRDDISSVTQRDSTRRDSMSSDKRRTSFSTTVHDGEERHRNAPLLSVMGLSRPGSPSRGGSSLSGHPSVSHDTHNNLKLLGGGRHHHPSQLVFAPGLSPSVSSSSSQPHDGLVTPHSRSTNRPSLHPSKSKDPYPDLMYGSSSISLLGSMGYLAYHDPLAEAMKKHRKQEAAARKNNAPMQGSQKTRPSAFLTTLMAKGPVNPRDHTILGAIWEGMLEGRFVNAAPVSLLQTYLEYHFTGRCSNPSPSIYTFPPTPPKEIEASDDETSLTPTCMFWAIGSDTDDARDAVIPRSKPKPRSTKSGKSANSNSSNGEWKEEKYLSRDSLVARQSPFVSFDGAHKDATIPHIVPRMPNTTLHVDLNTLNMQLTLRAKEIVACSESMWEWVEELQAGPAGDEVLNGSAAPWDTAGVDVLADTDVTRNIILDMTREDFDRLLCNFEWDMLDKACMGHALAGRFNWHTFENALLVDRKAYNKACSDYDEWLEQEHKLKPAVDTSRYSQHRSPNSTESISSTSDPEASTLAPTPSIRMSVDDGSSVVTLAAPSGGRILPETASNLGVVESASMVSNAPSQVLPQHMLSRALRVFVAWKAV
ncbi:hypothetical protein BJ912DRAFT_1063707 [Pholiota molesta]|nr:hypothetical protein BJ912DRAFT_1063707 [Pholiota molesta]